MVFSVKRTQVFECKIRGVFDNFQYSIVFEKFLFIKRFLTFFAGNQKSKVINLKVILAYRKI